MRRKIKRKYSFDEEIGYYLDTDSIREEFQEQLDEIEEDIKNACGIYINKWKPHNENLLNNEINKKDVTTDTQMLFSTLYLHYGNEKMLNELNEMIENEPDMKSETDECLQFIECLKSLQHIQEKDFFDTEIASSEPLYQVHLVPETAKDLDNLFV